MRRIQLIKRRRFSGFLFFVAFSWTGLGMGVDIKSGLIAKDFSTFLEKKLNTLFVDKDVKVSRVEGGGFRQFAIDEFSVYRKPTSPSPSYPIFSVDKIIIKYNLLNLALRRFENLGGIYLVSPYFYFSPNQTPRPAKLGAGFALPQGTYGKVIKFHILNGRISILGRNQPILENLKGQVSFCNSNLRFNNLEGSFLNIPVLVNGRIDDVLETPVIKLKLLARDRYYAAQCAFKSTGQKGEGFIWGSLRLFDKFDLRFKGSINIASGEIIEVKKLVVQPFPASKDFSGAGRAGFIVNGEINLSNKSSKIIIFPTNAGQAPPEYGAAQAGQAPLDYWAVNAGQASFIKVVTGINKEKGLSVHATLGHIKLFGHDVLSQMALNTNLYKVDSQEMLKGSLKTQNLILDYKPFKEIEANWVAKRKELFITNFDLGGVYRLFGKVKLNRPYDIDLNLSINNADLTDWVIFSNPTQLTAVSGLISGKLKIEGPLDAPLTNGRVNIKDGNVNNVKFNAINFNLKGKGPILTISDSRICKEGGFLCMDGDIDLRKFGKRNIFEDIKIKTDQKVIVWEGWDITKSPSEIEAKKELDEDFGINFKTYVNRENIDEDQKKSEIGLDYKIRKDDSINMRMKDDSAFVGVEHKIKF